MHCRSLEVTLLCYHGKVTPVYVRAISLSIVPVGRLAYFDAIGQFLAEAVRDKSTTTARLRYQVDSHRRPMERVMNGKSP